MTTPTTVETKPDLKKVPTLRARVEAKAAELASVLRPHLDLMEKRMERAN
jgi:hypothetical protein